MLILSIWGFGAVGSAPDWQSGGQGFKSPKLHQRKQRQENTLIFSCLFLIINLYKLGIFFYISS